MRGGNHSKDIREYIINERGMVIIAPHRTDYARLSSGLPERIGERKEQAPEPKRLK
jgi:circadian clock protein KaiC